EAMQVLQRSGGLADANAAARAAMPELTGARDATAAARDAAAGAGDAAAGAGGAAAGADATTAARARSADDLAALAQALPADLRGKIELRPVDTAGTRVVYEDGPVRIEVGPDATPWKVARHVDSARFLMRFQGPLGRIRRLISQIGSDLRMTPG